MNDARRRLLLCAGLGLVGCSGLGVPRSITLSEAELQAQLARRFPLQRSLFDAFELQLSDPRLRVDAAGRRLATELTISGSELRTGRSLRGRVALDFALRYEPQDGSIRLVQPRMQSLQFDHDQALPSRRVDLLQRLGGGLAERLLDDLTLYRVPPERLERLRAAGFQPGWLQVTPAGLEIGIEPVGTAAGKASVP